MVAYRDELTMPIDWEPKAFLPDLPAFAAAWSREREACAAFVAGNFEKLRGNLGVEARVVASGPRYLIACKP